MGLDITLLRLMRHRAEFDKLISGLPKAGLEPTTVALLDDFRVYFSEFPEVRSVEIDPFMMWFAEFRHPTYSTEQRLLYDVIMRKAETPIDPELKDGIMSRLLSAEFSFKALTLVDKWNSGEEFDLLLAMQSAVEEFEGSLNRKVRVPFVSDSIESMLQEDQDDSGIHWRLDCLNRSMRPMRGGDCIIVAGRPDKGKTTFLTSELSYIAPQVAPLGRPILWFNNEGPGRRIKQRFYQSLLGCTISEMIEKLQAGTLQDELREAAGGNPDDILKILDVHDFRSHEIEQVIKRIPPSLIVFDMIDNIRFSGDIANMGSRTDQLLEEMYKWGRNLAVRHDCPLVATSQISADGDGLAFPTLPMLKDSKTGKQGAADAIITIGALNDFSMDGTRFIGMTKNKLHREGGRKDPHAEVVFDANHARYNNPEA